MTHIMGMVGKVWTEKTELSTHQGDLVLCILSFRQQYMDNKYKNQITPLVQNLRS